ncbi:MAG: hypothetical protein ACRBFS_22820 [Aureispira sp.]
MDKIVSSFRDAIENLLTGLLEYVTPDYDLVSDDESDLSPDSNQESGTEEREEKSSQKSEPTDVKESKENKGNTPEAKPSQLEGPLGDCAYTSISIAAGFPGSETALRAHATDWLLNTWENNPQHEVFDYGEINAMIQTVSTSGDWNNDAGDLSIIVLAYTLDRTVEVVTSNNTYRFNPNAGNILRVYHYGNHYTSYPVENVHLSNSSVQTLTPLLNALGRAKNILECFVKYTTNQLTKEQEALLKHVQRILKKGVINNQEKAYLKANNNLIVIKHLHLSRSLARSLEQMYENKRSEIDPNVADQLGNFVLVHNSIPPLDFQKLLSNLKTLLDPEEEKKEEEKKERAIIYNIADKEVSPQDFIAFIKKHLPSNGHGDISGAVNDLELGRGKATTGYSVLHASAGKKGAKGGCTLFFERDAAGNINLVGIGQHLDQAEIKAHKKDLPKGTKVAYELVWKAPNSDLPRFLGL